MQGEMFQTFSILADDPVSNVLKDVTMSLTVQNIYASHDKLKEDNYLIRWINSKN